MQVDTALWRLTKRAGIHLSRYSWEIWFGGCSLYRGVILAPDADTVRTIKLNYLAQLQTVVPDVDVRVGQKPVDPTVKPKPSEGVFKKSFYQQQRLDEGES